MNNKIMLYAALVISQINASVESMYHDIKEIVEDRLTGQDELQRLYNVEEALLQLKTYKKKIQDDIIKLHVCKNSKINKTILGNIVPLLLGGYGIYVYRMGDISIDLSKKQNILWPFTVICGFFLLNQKNIEIYFKKNKIKELNVVISKLEALQDSLTEEVNSLIAAEEIIVNKLS
ncbi:MAG TPA: hypothetical protein VHX42_05140 [Candidatus Babeliales bacterium]|jgi:hypothetical protein|nr:hypothetical protein [Candidatus Babeliales bacterium]